MTKLFETDPTEVIFYARFGHGPYREAPQLICKAAVVRCTATQLIVAVPYAGKETRELRFYKEDGGLVGGRYGHEKVAPITHETNLAATESAIRRRVHAAIQTVSESERQLNQLRIGSLPMTKVHEIEADLALVRNHLKKVLAATKQETT